MTLKQTPSQTVGPYFAYGLTPEQYGYPFKDLVNGDLTTPDTAGNRIRIEGCVYDGEGNPVPDAMIEIWQMLWPLSVDKRNFNFYNCV